MRDRLRKNADVFWILLVVAGAVALGPWLQPPGEEGAAGPPPQRRSR